MYGKNIDNFFRGIRFIAGWGVLIVMAIIVLTIIGGGLLLSLYGRTIMPFLYAFFIAWVVVLIPWEIFKLGERLDEYERM